MGVIKDRIDEIFADFDKHQNFYKLIDAMLVYNNYKWGWQQDESNSYIREKLEKIKNNNIQH